MSVNQSIINMSQSYQKSICYAMPCYAIPCHAMGCHAMGCYAMPWDAMLCHGMHILEYVISKIDTFVLITLYTISKSVVLIMLHTPYCTSPKRILPSTPTLALPSYSSLPLLPLLCFPTLFPLLLIRLS